ncbi:hypothetical protein [Lihuaxuella thermophila]|uniref:Uncharacterized protein n=1 Tax=Lihuaxuella thermophila TaxID=1173111 RepID=A0A1H8IXT9_9BACL|nr:hypothetical protein [Lihuaxuella thermophila]SEN73414.1 hypothetical protein SAMN05444955_12024 [Lihuaxuella thermophila]
MEERELYRNVPNPEVCEIPGVCGNGEEAAGKGKNDPYKPYYTARSRNRSPFNDPLNGPERD